MRHPALLQGSFVPMTAEEALRFSSLVSAALDEDGARKDITSEAVIPEDERAEANIVLRKPAVLAGLAIASLAFSTLDPSTQVKALESDGQAPRSAVLARVRGKSRSVLAAERVALNFLGRLSGIATLTRRFVDAVTGLPVRICDTRKTTPGLRRLERYGVRAGGGFNHRFNLSDAVLIKDNHIVAAGSIEQAIAHARRHISPDVCVEVECESLAQVEAALRCSPDALLLDNMTLEDLRESVRLADGKTVLEASGGVTLDNVREIALTGVSVISVGALTHSAAGADVALDFNPQPEADRLAAKGRE